MINKNDPRFLSPWGERLAELGLDVRDVCVGRYVQIDLSKPRKEPEEFAEFGEFDTFTVLNPDDVPPGVWRYLNNKRPESRIPLHYLSRLETVADRFYLQHDEGWDDVVLHIILGGDLRALNVEPSKKGAVTIRGTVDVSDREDRELGIVSVPGVATELTLEAVRALLESLDGKDFATETKLESVRVLLESLDGKDFATETTLEAVRGLLESLDGKDFATETKLETVRVLLASLENKNFATEDTLSSISNTLNAILAELQTQTALLENIKNNTEPTAPVA